MSTTKPSESPRRTTGLRRRRWVFLSAGLLLFLAILVALPEVMRWGAVRALRDLGLSTTIANVDFNPFSGRLVVDQLWAQSGPVPVLTADRIELQLHWRALWDRTLQIQELRLQGSQLLVAQSGEGQLSVAAIALPMDDGAGEPAPQASADGEPWALRLDHLLWQDGRIEAALPQGRQKLLIENLRIEDLHTGRPQQPLRFELDAVLNAARVRLSGDARPLAEPLQAGVDYEVDTLSLETYRPWLPLRRLQGELAASGRLALEQSPTAGLSLRQTGDLRVARLSVEGEQPGLAQVGQLELSSELQLVSADDGLELRLPQLAIGLSGLELATPQIELDLDSTRWNGDLVLSNTGNLRIDASGGLELQGVAADLLKPAHRLQLDSLAWQGEVRLDQQAGDLPAVTGQLELAALDLRERNLDLRLLALQRLALQDLALSPDARLALARATLNDAELLQIQGAPTVLRLGQVVAREINASAEQGVAMAQLDISDLRLDLTRNEQGELLVIRLLTADPAEAAPAAQGDAAVAAQTASAEPAPEDAQPAEVQAAEVQAGEVQVEEAAAAETAEAGAPGVRIDTLLIAGDSSLRLLDQSVEPPFDARLAIASLRLTGLDTGKAGQPLQIDLRGRTGRGSEIQVEGEARPFLVEPAARLQGRISDYDLPPLSSYTRGALGYQLRSGLVDVDFEVDIGDGLIDARTRFNLVGLELTPSDEDKMQALTQRLVMPLPSALDLLRKDDGGIELEVPVTGQLYDPQFNVSDAINQALGTAMKAGVFSYLTTMLQPYGTLISLAQMAGESITRLRLDPVVYTPGSAEPPAEAGAYLEKIAALLADKPELTLRLCGYFNAADIQALTPPPPPPAPTGAAKPGEAAATPAPPPPTAAAIDPRAKAEELAYERTVGLQRLLVETHGISAGRLPLCLPELDPDAEAVARVELLI